MKNLAKYSVEKAITVFMVVYKFNCKVISLDVVKLLQYEFNQTFVRSNE